MYSGMLLIVGDFVCFENVLKKSELETALYKKHKVAAPVKIPPL